MALGFSSTNRAAFLSKSVGMRRAAVCGIAAFVFASGCTSIAWENAPVETLQTVAARAPFAAPADEALGSLIGAVSAITDATGAPPKIEVMAGITSITLGNKLAGTTDAGDVIAWDDAFTYNFGLDAQIVLKRPPRPVSSLAAGDTFMLLRVTVDTFTGERVSINGSISDYSKSDDLYILSGYLDGKTVFNPLGEGTTFRPYLQYGGGLASMTAVDREDDNITTDVENWAATIALTFHMGIGMEIRPWSGLGIYVEAGVQNVKKPNLASGADEANTAEDLLEYPLRVGVMFAF